MWRKRAERFEASLQRAARGEKAEEPYRLLVETAQSVASIEVPPPPRGLVEGRRRLAAEAVTLHGQHRPKQRTPIFPIYRMRLVPVLASLLLVLALLPFFSQEVAASLPGNPLYGLKLFAQDVHLWLTNSPDAQADLDVSVAESRRNDVASALEQGQNIDKTTAESTEKQLVRAVRTVAQNDGTADAAAPFQLMTAIQNCERVMVRTLNQMSESDQEPLRELLRQMQMARAELHTGAGEASGELERVRQGDPPGPEELPFGMQGTDPGWQAPEPPGQGAGDPGAGESGEPGQGANQPQEPAGAAQATQAPPAAGSTPDPASPPEQTQQQGNGEQQKGPGTGEPSGTPPSGDKGNNEHSKQP